MRRLRSISTKRLRSAALVREREALHEKKLEVANLRENLVHEEFSVKVTDVYDFSDGKCAKEVGGFGEVQAVRHRQTGAKYAMKTIPLSRVKDKAAFEFVMKEVDLLKSLDHPNIVRLQEVYVTPSHLHIAMDLIEGGNLAVRYKFEGEERAAVIIRQIARALRYLHDRRIAHRDLKLENILLETRADENTPSVKLVDFGLSAIYEENGVSTDVLGSWNYVAPEVIKGHYRPAPADMWSLGVVAYALMSGTLPFHADSTDIIKHKILAARYHFPGPGWARMSEGAKHFVRSLLQKRPELRLDAATALLHAWLREAEEESQAPAKDDVFRDGVTRSMLAFRQANGMAQLGLEVVAHTLDPAQIHLLAEEFDRADNNNNGEVSLVEFKRWLATNGAAKGMTEEDVEALFRSVDVDGSGFIHFNEFLAATMQQRQIDEAHLRLAFDHLDRSHTGFINLDDVTLTTGVAATEKEAAVLISYFDANGDGEISFQEFVNGMARIRGSGREDGPLQPRVPASPTPASQIIATAQNSNFNRYEAKEQTVSSSGSVEVSGASPSEAVLATPVKAEAVPGDHYPGATGIGANATNANGFIEPLAAPGASANGLQHRIGGKQTQIEADVIRESPIAGSRGGGGEEGAPVVVPEEEAKNGVAGEGEGEPVDAGTAAGGVKREVGISGEGVEVRGLERRGCGCAVS